MNPLSSSLCYFNPGHETAVWEGNAHYTPPAPVRKMTADLALLPLWYGDADDYVLTDDAAAAHAFLASLPPTLRPSVTPFSSDERCTTALKASPWGLSPQSIYLFVF